MGAKGSGGLNFRPGLSVKRTSQKLAPSH